MPKALKKNQTAQIVARIHGVSADYVRKIRNGERENDEIMATLLDYERYNEKLIRHLEKLVPLKPVKRPGRKKAMGNK